MSSNNSIQNLLHINKLTVRSAPNKSRSARLNTRRTMSNPVIGHPRSSNTVISSPLEASNSEHYEDIIENPYNMLNSEPIEVMKNYISYFNDNASINHNKAITKYNSSSQMLQFTFHIIKLSDPNEYELDHFFLVSNNDVVYINRHIVDVFLKGLKKTIGKALDVTGNALCSGAINKGYIIEQFHENSFCILSFGINKKNLRSQKEINFVDNIGKYDLLGFIFCDFYEHNRTSKKPTIKSVNDCYISLVCSNKKFGSLMIEMAEQMASFFGFDNMRLSAVETAITYYLKIGYLPIIDKKSKQTYEYSLSKFLKVPISKSKKLNSTKTFIKYTTSQKLRVKSNTQQYSRRLQKKQENSKGKGNYILHNVVYDYDNNMKMIKKL